MYDLAVIGSGWAGINAAQKAKGLGLKACIIEKDQIGGTCLNYGCIPTKSLIHSAKVYSIGKKAGIFGVETGDLRFDLSVAQEHKDKTIAGLRRGIEFLLKGVDILKGEARLVSDREIQAGGKRIEAKAILIAAGSKPIEVKGLEFNAKNILSSNQILESRRVPESLLIVGGGAIGCEFASLFSALGCKVTIAEKLTRLLPGEDADVSRKLEAAFKKKNITVRTSTDVLTLDRNSFELVLVCVGRAAAIDGLGLEKAGVSISKGKIIVDDHLKTSVANIYAAGDCAAKIMLAHFASYQGEIAARNIANPSRLQKADSRAVPNCVFTDPEIARVGMTEDEALGGGRDIAIRKFDFLGSGMARIIDETDGFIKIVADKGSEEILGSSIIGPRAAELIGILTLAVTLRLKLTQLRQAIFAHPTLSEGIKEAC